MCYYWLRIGGEVMERLILKKLIEWKMNDDRKPLILKGVRQCGKTYILKYFGEHNYEDIAYFNFEEMESLNDVFEQDYDTNRILLDLGLLLNKTIHKGTTLIIFDEIQACGRAITSLKYFSENNSEYHIVCAGSLLGITLNKQSSFPVGKVDFLTLYPMNYLEFLLANGESMLVDYLINISKNIKISEPITNKLTNYLKEYYITGGMPEVVKAWCDTHDIEMVERVQQRILDSYNFDFSKHAPLKDVPKISAIWQSIPEQLAKENNKFIFGQVRKGWRGRDLEDALIWLENAGLVYKVFRISKPFLPLSSYSEPSHFKLYMCDVGLLRKMAKLPYEVILNSIQTFTEFKGALCENYVLCELLKVSDDIPYYWTSGNTAEVDFVIQAYNEIVPIEVKAEKNIKSKSLSEYIKTYEPKYAIKTSLLSDLVGDKVVRIPLYLIWQYKNILD